MPPHSSYLKSRREPKKSRGSYENSQVLDLGRRWTHLGKFQLCHRIPHTYSLKKNSKRCAKKFPKKEVKTKCTWLLKKYGFGFFFSSFLALQDKQTVGFYNRLMYYFTICH